MSIAQPRFVKIKFTRKFDFWEASRALPQKRLPKYAIEPYAQKKAIQVRYRALRAKKVPKYAVKPYAQKKPSKYAIEPYAQKKSPSTV